jgi:hypothetical protein
MAKKKNLNAAKAGKLGGAARINALSHKQRAALGKRGGQARAKSLSAAERKRIARHAVAVREKRRAERRKNQ